MYGGQRHCLLCDFLGDWIAKVNNLLCEKLFAKLEPSSHQGKMIVNDNSTHLQHHIYIYMCVYVCMYVQLKLKENLIKI